MPFTSLLLIFFAVCNFRPVAIVLVRPSIRTKIWFFLFSLTFFLTILWYTSGYIFISFVHIEKWNMFTSWPLNLFFICFFLYTFTDYLQCMLMTFQLYLSVLRRYVLLSFFIFYVIKLSFFNCVFYYDFSTESVSTVMK